MPSNLNAISSIYNSGGPAEVGVPPVQAKPSSTSQLLSQPSPVDVLVSSQASVPALLPSPHTVFHAESGVLAGILAQLNPGSIKHRLLHPSPL